MPLNKFKGNMYPFVTHTWNPIRGKCPYECNYCYMKNLKVGELRLEKKELNLNLDSGKIIFIGSSTDMFAENVPDEWIEKVLKYCGNFNNQYLFQTKNPGRFVDFIDMFPDHSVLGTTIETNKFWITDKLSLAPVPTQRKRWIEIISRDYEKDTMVSIEPILDLDRSLIAHWIRQIKPKFVSIGADSKNHNLQEPKVDQVRYLIRELRETTKVYVKKNLYRILEGRNEN